MTDPLYHKQNAPVSNARLNTGPPTRRAPGHPAMMLHSICRALTPQRYPVKVPHLPVCSQLHPRLLLTP